LAQWIADASQEASLLLLHADFEPDFNQRYAAIARP
jgi:hypothetical protein